MPTTIDLGDIKPVKQKKYVIKVLIIALSLITVNGALFFHEQYIYDGFFFSTRLPALVSANMAHVDMYFYQSFPTSPFYVLELEQITGLNVETIIYIPIFLIISVFCYFVLARLAFRSDLLGLLMAISVVAFAIGKFVHFSEYPAGRITYPLFLFVGYKALTTNRIQYVALLAPFMMLLWGFAPHGQVRAVSFISVAGVIFAYYQYRTNGLHSTNHQTDRNAHMFTSLEILPRQITTLAVLSVIFIFWFTGKFYTGFVGRLDIKFTSPLSPIIGILIGIVNPTHEGALKYGESPHLTGIAQTIDMTYMFLTAVVLALSGLLIVYLLFCSGDDYVHDSVHELILAVGVASYLPDMILMLFSGNFQLAIIRELGPILTLGILFSTIKRIKIPTIKRTFHIGAVILIIIFFILGIASQVSFVTTGAPTDTPSDAQTQSMGAWIYQYGEADRVLTDLKSVGYLRTAIAKITGDARNQPVTYYSDTRYAYLIGDNVSAATPTPEFRAKFGTPKPPERIGYILLNWATPTEPLKRGSPDWRSFQSIGEHKNEIETNHRINRIFATGQYTIERPVGKN